MQRVRERFEASERLCQFLLMLEEYRFTPARLEWLATEPEDAVFKYCAHIDGP